MSGTAGPDSCMRTFEPFRGERISILHPSLSSWLATSSVKMSAKMALGNGAQNRFLPCATLVRGIIEPLAQPVCPL